MATYACIVCGQPMTHTRLRGYICQNERHNAARREIEHEASLMCKQQPALGYDVALKIARQHILGRDPRIVVYEE